MMRHLKRCIQAGERPLVGPAEGTALMNLIDAIYKSAESGRSVEVKQERNVTSPSPLGAA